MEGVSLIWYFCRQSGQSEVGDTGGETKTVVTVTGCPPTPMTGTLDTARRPSLSQLSLLSPSSHVRWVYLCSDEQRHWVVGSHSLLPFVVILRFRRRISLQLVLSQQTLASRRHYWKGLLGGLLEHNSMAMMSISKPWEVRPLLSTSTLI